MSEIETTLLPMTRRDYSAAGMEELFARIDRLHDLAMDGRLAEATDLSRGDLRGWIEDLIYTLRETLAEMDAR